MDIEVDEYGIIRRKERKQDEGISVMNCDYIEKIRQERVERIEARKKEVKRKQKECKKRYKCPVCGKRVSYNEVGKAHLINCFDKQIKLFENKKNIT